MISEIIFRIVLSWVRYVFVPFIQLHVRFMGIFISLVKYWKFWKNSRIVQS